MVAISETLNIRVVRRKINLSFMPGESVQSIREAMAKIPEAAVVDECDTSDSGITTVVFHYERACSDLSAEQR